MVTKKKPVEVASMLTTEDIRAYYSTHPIPPSRVETFFPLIQSESTKWKTLSNISTRINEAADPISLNSQVPVAGRDGFKDMMGEMTTFGKGREMDADQIERFENLKRRFLQLKNSTAAAQLINYYGGDLDFVRSAMNVEKQYLCWALLSAACSIDFVAANSPYMQGLTAMDYEVSGWQKDNVATSWDNAAAEILDDIQSVVDTGKNYGKNYLDIFVNKKWFNHVRNNTQVQNYTASLVQSLMSTQAPPTLEQVNSMLGQYFDVPVQFIVIDEEVTRAKAAGTKNTENPFGDGVAVFAQGVQLGHFEWNAIPIIDGREAYESFFTVGNYKQIDPNYSKIYAKGRGFPVIDTYADNFYLKIDAVAW